MSRIHYPKYFRIALSCFIYCHYCLFVYPTFTLRTREMRISTGTFLACLQVIKAVEITICDCTSSKKNGLLKVNRQCELEKPIDPDYVKYEITTVRSEKLHFKGHFCSAKTVWFQTSVKAETEHTAQKLGICFKMAGIEIPGTHDCLEDKKMIKVGNKWTYHDRLLPTKTFLYTTGSATRNCLYEEIPLVRNCPDCPVSSALGPIEPNQMARHNNTLWVGRFLPEGVVMYKEEDAVIEQCKKRLLTSGDGKLFKVDDNSYRLSDDSKQIDFVITKESKKENRCNITLDDHQYWALEMAGFIVSVYFPEKLNDDTASPTESKNQSHSRSSRDLKLDVDELGHLQFVRDRVIDNENLLVRIIRKLQCENRRDRLITAIADSRINGWAAAKNLDFQTCTRLVPFGETARIETCSSSFVNISTKKTICGPQPFFNNFTVNLNGYELVKFSNCYHTGNMVNFNGQPYSFQDDDWVLQEANIVVNEKGVINEFSFEADNALENFINADYDSQQGVFDQISVLSDIVAVLNEHDIDPTLKRPHVSSILIDAHEHENHSWWQSIANWMKIFGWVTLGCGSAFLLYRLFGGQTIAKNIFIWMGLPPWAVYLMSCDFLGICSSEPQHDEQLTYEMVNIANPTLNKEENQRSSRK